MFREWTDEDVDGLLGGLLRVGVVLAAIVVLAGGVVYLLRHGTEPAGYGVFYGEPDDFRSPSGILRGALSLRGRGLIQLGLLLLIATPVARVAFSVAAFAIQRDRMYVAITVMVLLLLLFSLFGARLPV
ncbi:MAG TPA: DUF1634 domain-containing protein [Bryobacteraceae bacterium]|nr:DUF1634 domain-containing protein [Bryobacteraceae bacterium]